MNIIGGRYWTCDRCGSRTWDELFACPKCGGRLSAGWCKGDELHWPEKENLTTEDNGSILEGDEDDD
jgi:hypothetical protein